MEFGHIAQLLVDVVGPFTVAEIKVDDMVTHKPLTTCRMTGVMASLLLSFYSVFRLHALKKRQKEGLVM